MTMIETKAGSPVSVSERRTSRTPRDRIAALVDQIHRAHRRVFGFSLEIELVWLRLLVELSREVQVDP